MKGEMTVKEFLAAGHKFVAGDTVLGPYGRVHTIAAADCDLWNLPSVLDDIRFVGKAKCLKETKVDKPKTKVEYKLVDSTANEIAKRMIDGEVFYSGCGKILFKWDGKRFVNNNSTPIGIFSSFYQKVEITTWRDEARDFITASDTLTPNCWLRKLIDADSQFEPVVSKEFVGLCKLVAKRNGGCE